jgi:LPXTG-site transpeptidase (sortase) family protein
VDASLLALRCVSAATIYDLSPQVIEPLQDNGGPTETLALQAGSPAINTGDGWLCTATDQRGVARAPYAPCDIGAFESGVMPPTDIVLSNSTTPENQPIGTLIGTLTTTDPDAGETHTYNLQSGVSGCDDSGNGSFQIPGGTDQLQSAAVFDYETLPISFNICIRTTDSYGFTYDEQFTINITDLDELAPSLTAFLRNTPATSPTNADVLVFRATFDEDVQNVDAADFAVDGATTATVTGVAAVDARTYDITVSGGDLASVNGDVGLNLGGTQNIEDLAGNPLPAGEPATDEVYTLDNISPSVLITSTAGNPTNTSPIPVTITFSAPVTDFDLGDLTVGNGGAGNFSGGGAVYTADITPAANGLVTVDVAAGAAVDGAGNGNTAAPQFSITYDNAFPTVLYLANTIPANNSVLLAGPTQIFLEFSKDVVADGSADAADNTANYVLMEDGTDNVFNTTGCAAVDAVNDTSFPVDAAAYDNNGGAGPFLATLDVNGGVALPPGTYRLFVCGTTSIYDPAGNRLNDGADSLLNFTVSGPAAAPETGFAPNRVTVLPPQEIAYTKLGDLWLEIPRLGVRADIVGVPLNDGEWDVTWLGENAGWLEGTAFPTWAGNSVITAHVWDAYNRPGPFYGLNILGWGDPVIVHAWGGKYAYEVRQVLQVRAADTAAMLKHQELPWVTLVTCQGYDQSSDSYRYRVLVRAVLVEVR